MPSTPAKLWIESAGTIDGGRKVWILAHIDHDMQIAGEKINSYLLFLNGHDGRTSVTAAAMDERFYCSNQLTFGQPNSEHVVRIRHTSKAGQRIQEAHAILGMRNRRTEELVREGERLAAKKITEGKFAAIVEQLMPIKEPDTPAATMITNRRASVVKLYNEAPNLADIRGTAWAGLQAVIEYADHGREFRDSGTQLKAQWGFTPATIKQRAYELLAA